MKNTREFPFDQARHVTATEVAKARKAIESKLGKKRKSRGRPPKPRSERYCAVSIRLHPRIVSWAKAKARREHVGYQTVINEVLLKLAA